MTRLIALYIARSDRQAHDHFTAMEPWVRWTSRATLQPEALAVGDIAVLASRTTNARVPPGGWNDAHFALVRFTRVTALDLRPSAVVAELAHTHAFHDVPGDRLGPALTEALRRSANRAGHPHAVNLGLDLALLTPTRSTTTRSSLNRPAHFSDADWAEYQQCQAEHDGLMAQVAAREAQMENGLIDTYDEYEFDFTAPAEPKSRPVRRTAELSDHTDRASAYVYGNALLALTDQLNGTESHADAAALLHQILDPTSGLLERLGEFFEAAGEKAKDAEQDDGFDLSYDLADAAAEIRDLGEVLHVAEDRMRALTSPPAPRPSAAPPHTPRLPPPVLPPAQPRRTR